MVGLFGWADPGKAGDGLSEWMDRGRLPWAWGARGEAHIVSFARYDRKIKNVVIHRTDVHVTQVPCFAADRRPFAFVRQRATFKRAIAAHERLSSGSAVAVPSRHTAYSPRP